MKYMILAVAALASLAASAQKSIRMIVHEEPKDCRRMTEMTCLQVQIDGSKDWTLFYDKIKGFDYEPGYRYEIIVIETPRPEPVAQDLPRNNYRLDKIISKTAITSGTAESPVWKVLSINGLQLNSDEFYFDFNEDSSMLTGKSGCNQFSVPVKFNGKRTKFTTGSATSTLMACSDEAMKQESSFLSSIQNKKFKIRKENGQIIYRKGWFRNVFVTEQFTPFTKTMTMDTPWDSFDGKTMKIIQLNGKSVKGQEAHLAFDTANGRFSGNNGCNRISGNFSSEGTAIGFSGVISTKMACTDENMQQTERQVMQILNSPGLSFDFAERVLNIYDGSGTLVMMLAQWKRNLAFSGGEIPLIGLGTYKLNGSEGQKAIEVALECGYRHIDTARMYENESEVGAAIRGSEVSREEVFVTTKIWPADFRKVITATEDSLRNLGTDYVDLLLLHWPTDRDSIRKAAEDLNEVIHKGYARSVGVSNFNIELIDMVKAIAPICCDQVEYHPFLSQEKLLAHLRNNDLFMTAYRPLAQGKLEGNKILAEIGGRYGKTDAQVALRWIVQQDVVAIPKSASPERIRANIDIFDFELLPQEMEEISRLQNGTRLTTPEWSPEWD